MKIPQIKNDFGPLPGLPIPLPSNSKYGNLQLKSFKLYLRIESCNQKIVEIYNYWERDIESHKLNQMGLFTTHNTPMNNFKTEILNEELIYGIRRTCDELVSLSWVLEEFKREGVWPEKIKIDSIGNCLRIKDGERPIICKGHEATLSMINDISNCYKHSFLHSDLDREIDANGPIICALALEHNDLGRNTPVYHKHYVEELVLAFDSFFTNSMNWFWDPINTKLQPI
jgi:hypothetical protein